MRKPDFYICENKDADRLYSMLISTFVFTTVLGISLFFFKMLIVCFCECTDRFGSDFGPKDHYYNVKWFSVLKESQF